MTEATGILLFGKRSAPTLGRNVLNYFIGCWIKFVILLFSDYVKFKQIFNRRKSFKSLYSSLAVCEHNLSPDKPQTDVYLKCILIQDNTRGLEWRCQVTLQKKPQSGCSALWSWCKILGKIKIKISNTKWSENSLQEHIQFSGDERKLWPLRAIEY